VGFFDRLRDGLSRTTQQLVDRFDDIVQRADTPAAQATAVDVDTVEALEELLLSADIGVAATERIVNAVRDRARRGESLRDLVKTEILNIFKTVEQAPAANGHHPHVTLIVGVNGTGKTTTIGKLANLLKVSGKQPLVCAADTFRAAAVEQLEIWAKRADVDIIRAKEGSDPAALVFDAIQSGKTRGRDPILVDTAGRLHTRVNLMNELDKIRRVAARAAEGAPHEVLLVLDATVGQNGLAQAREFTSVAGVTGIVLTKLDGTAKGGIAVAIAHDLKLPIRYVGVGEGIDDLIPFSAQEYVDALFQQMWLSIYPPKPRRRRTSGGCGGRWSTRAAALAARRRTPWSALVSSPMRASSSATARMSARASRTPRSSRSRKPANARAAPRSTARSSRAPIRVRPGHARIASSPPASRASSRRWRIRSRW
jgi:fused signal recognition particle receptor